MSTQKNAAGQVIEEAQGLIKALKAMPEDKQTWKPLDAGRSAFELVLECAGSNLFIAGAIENGAAKMPTDEERTAFASAITDVASLEKTLDDSVKKLTAAIEAVPDERLGSTIKMPFRGGVELPIGDLIWRPSRHMYYHLGQVNYIQTLYGDKQMH